MSAEKIEKYQKFHKDVEALLGEETDPVVWMSSIACLLKTGMGFFWAGFYRVKRGRLVIGPYQGTFGCLEIDFDRGVCGACASKGETILVSDVHEFPGHIACDTRSRSEIVVPVFDAAGGLKAVLDIDSTEVNSFDEVDRENLEKLAIRMKRIDWNPHY